MKTPIRILTFAAAALAVAFLVLPDAYSCHGILRYRFMPIEKARVEFQRVQAELKKQSLLIPELITPELQRWIKYYDNPIFKPGASGSWESISSDCQTVLYHDGTYYMWYSGTPQGLNAQQGLATSSDGIHWTRHPDNPVLRLGAAGEWDNSIMICQHVLFDKEEGVFKMWYLGGSSAGVFAIGYATSPDGAHWTKYAGNPVMRTTEPWEGTTIEGQTLLKVNGVYKMWFGGIDLDTDISHVGYAESPDGIHWTKYAGNPILSPAEGSPLPWDGYSVDTPDVHYDGRLYHMYYRGWRREAGISWIGHATSPDGLVWTRDAGNPILVTSSVPGAWDSFQIYRSRVFWAEGEEDRPAAAVDRMWFTGRNTTLKSQIGLAFGPRRDDSTPTPPGGRIPMTVNQDNMNLEVQSRPTGGVQLRYFTPWLSKTALRIYDAAGRIQRIIVDEPQLPGFYERTWDGRNTQGRVLPAGLYYAELSTPTYVLTKEVLLAR
ncbi:MAG: FlgD immunoglobulin-like domain containing protein [Acidobacteriota bacterium]|nr:FlgD immunoglobulin-like domain containing protein [Acidobacteriota bacterium]